MKNKILSITEKVPQVATLPDGLYKGIQSSNVIELTCNGKQYELTCEEGIRGFNNHVVVEIKDGVATYDNLL